MFEIDGETDKEGSWYQRLAKVVLDVCVSVLVPFVVKFSNIKVPRGSMELKYRISKHDLNYADSTRSSISAAWTQGSLSAPKVGELFAPEHPPLPQYSLDHWIAKLKLKDRALSTVPTSPPPQIEKLRTFSSIDAMEDESRENSDTDSLDIYEMATAKDEEMKDFLHNKISEGLPAVCDSLDHG